MKRVLPLILLLLLAGSALANPVNFDPVGHISFFMVVVSAFTIEVAIVTLLLLFWGTEPKPLFLALFLGNAVIYFAVFLPLFNRTSSLWVSEAAVVVLDGLLIKAITRFDTFQQDTYRPVRWVYVFVIAGIGNSISYYVGLVTTG